MLKIRRHTETRDLRAMLPLSMERRRKIKASDPMASATASAETCGDTMRASTGMSKRCMSIALVIKRFPPLGFLACQ
jgi:hypothetical protein